MAIAAEIIAVGNELLIGDVVDTNSNWLCRRLTALGATVQRVVQIGDIVGVIAEAVRSSLARGTQLLITTGGLGPTEDDLTLQGVAEALGRTLEPHAQALELVAAWYRELARRGWVASGEMTPSRAKMACLPTGAEPLANTVGAAPGVLLRVARDTAEECLIICLPGVPEELKDIFTGSLAPTLSELLGHSDYQEWRATVACNDESLLTPLLRAVSRAHSAVYVKSRAKRFSVDVRFEITLSARGQGPDGPSSEVLLEATWGDLERALHAAGIAVLGLARE